MTKKETLTLDDALRLNGPRAFNLMIKPVGSTCNLNCAYCYYLDKADIYGGREPKMALEDLERLIKRYIEACEIPVASFLWHGGEPLLSGLDFFRSAVEFQKKYAGGKEIRNTLQTNGTLLTDEWASFFRENGFLIGISVDGPSTVHNTFRKTRGGGPSLEKALRGIEILNRNRVEYNILATINRESEGRGREVYRFLKSLGTRFIQFSPVVEHIVREQGRRPRIVDPSVAGAELAPWSVSAKGFGEFLCDVFSEWVNGDIGRVFVNYFDATLANWCGVMPGICAFARTCGDNSIVEHNGDVYSCDHFVYPEYRIGNIFEDSLPEMMDSPSQVRFGISKRNSLPEKCLRCEYLRLCNGGCPKHRFNATERGETGLNALCDGYRQFFSYSSPMMQEMKSRISERSL